MVEDSGRYVSAFPDVSIQMQNKKKYTLNSLIQSYKKKEKKKKKKMKGDINQRFSIPYPLRPFTQTLRTADFLFTEVGCAGTGETKQKDKHNKLNPLSHSLHPILFLFFFFFFFIDFFLLILFRKEIL